MSAVSHVVSCTALVLLLHFCPVAARGNNRREILEERWKLQAQEMKENKLKSVNNETIKIEPDKSFGTWTGWGTSLAWWAVGFGNRDDLADAIFSLNESVTVLTKDGSVKVPGLGLTIARYNIGASSHTPAGGDHMVVSPNMNPERAVDALFLTWEHNNTYDWSRDANQRAMLQKAHVRGANTLQLFSNSPVWFHLNNHNPSGANNGADDNLQTWNHRQFAQMMAEVAAHFSTAWGLKFQSVEAFNEPISNWWTAKGTQEGCHFDVATQKSIVQELRKQLDAYGLHDTHIAASDENTYTEAISTWKGLGDTARGLFLNGR